MLRLDGWFFEVPFCANDANPMTVIMSHGYAGTRLKKGFQPCPWLKPLSNAGNHVLMFDFRNSGKLGREYNYGWFFGKARHARCYRLGSGASNQVKLLDWLFHGRQSSILAAAEEKAVLGVITDSAFSQLSPYLKDNLPVWSNLPGFPFTPLILLILPRLIGVNPHALMRLAADEYIVSKANSFHS